MSDRPTLSLPSGRTKHRFDVRGRGNSKPAKPFVARGHQATLDENIGKQVKVLLVNGRVIAETVLASDAYTITLTDGADFNMVIFKHAIVSVLVAKAKVTTEPVTANV